MILDNWDKVKEELLEGLKGSRREIMNTILEGQRDYVSEKLEKKVLTPEEEADEIVRILKTPPTSPNEELQKVIIPMIRRIMPGVIAADILGTAPMQVRLEKYIQ
jgi:hypothetical protein